MPSDTPRTDAAEEAWTHLRVVSADFARRLESELAAMKQQRDEARREICRAIAYERAKLSGVFDPKAIAAERGWDCYKEWGGA